MIAAESSARPELLRLLSLNTGAATKLAKALEGSFNVPGMRAQNKPVVTSR